MPQQTTILNDKDVFQKLERIAYEIVEDNYDEKELIIVGVNNKGMVLAHQIADRISKILPIKVTMANVRVNAARPTETPVEIDTESPINGKVVIIVDDVANTGRTMLYAMKPFLEYLPKKIQTAVMVDRKHKLFPICADFVGISLSTSLQEHITVKVNNRKRITEVYLD